MNPLQLSKCIRPLQPHRSLDLVLFSSKKTASGYHMNHPRTQFHSLIGDVGHQICHCFLHFTTPNLSISTSLAGLFVSPTSAIHCFNHQHTNSNIRPLSAVSLSRACFFHTVRSLQLLLSAGSSAFSSRSRHATALRVSPYPTV